MALQPHGKELYEQLKHLYAIDQESFTAVRSALYDWIIVLQYCFGALETVQIIESACLDNRSVDILQEIHRRVDFVVKDMGLALSGKDKR